ncbi:MAG: TolC family outer membrane protein [Burkholderiales bacterium]
MTRVMKRIPLLLALIGASPALHAADLMEVYRDALSSDPVYASARAARDAGLEALPEGRSQFLPNIGLSGSQNRSDIARSGSQSGYDSRVWSLSLSQPLFRWQNWAAYKQGEERAKQAEAQFAGAGQDLILRVAQAYFDVLLAQDNVDLARAQKAAISEQLAQAKINFEVGTATITDTNDAQARYDLVNAQEIAAGNDLEVKRQTLQQIIGKYPGSLNPLGSALSLSLPDPDDMEQWVASAVARNPQVASQQAALEIAQREVDKNRAGHLPTLDLVASRTKNSNAIAGTTSLGQITTDSVGLQFNLPLYQGGYVSAKVREAAAGLEKARQDLELANRQAALQTRQAFLGVSNGLAQVKALEQALVSNQSALDSSQLGQEVGVRTSLDVLNARQQLFTAKRDLSQARYNYILSRIKLKAAAGMLGEADVEQVNRWLNGAAQPAPGPSAPARKRTS